MALNTLKRRLGNGLVALLKASNAILDNLLGGAASTLAIEYAARWVAKDGGQARCLVTPYRDQPSPRSGNKESGRTRFGFRIVFELWDDRGANISIDGVYQALDTAFADQAAFFNSYVTDTEANLLAKDGTIEFEEEMRAGLETNRPMIVFLVFVSCWHKRPMTTT